MLLLLATKAQTFLDLPSLTTGRSVLYTVRSTRNQELLSLELLMCASVQVFLLPLTSYSCAPPELMAVFPSKPDSCVLSVVQ